MSSTQYNRASLLNGLRTGGVRSASANIPHTAAPGATTFNVSRYPAQSHPTNIFPEEEEDQLAEMPQHVFNNRNFPMTAAVDGKNHFSQQQAQYPNVNNFQFNPSFPHPNMMSPAVQNQAMSMQMLQLEMLRIQAQAIQNQQYQAELIAQAQRQQQQIQNQTRRAPHNYQPPATTGPANLSFDHRAIGAQSRRPNQADQLRAQLGLGPAPASADDHVPMTAALGGRFGSRSASSTAPIPTGARYAGTGEYDNAAPPPTPSSTTVISGGTSLGNPTSNNVSPPSKSDSVSSWRRGGSNSVLAGNRAVSSPLVKITAPDNERTSPPPGLHTIANAKSRPLPLRFNPAVSQPLPAVTVVDTDEDGDADSSCSSGKTHSSPTTPRSSASSNEVPLSPREEASKKLYEGLGIGRPTSASPEQQQYPTVSVVSHRMASQPARQPRGPPSGADELGPKNFATRIRRKAIGGLLDARGRREVVEVF
ncbi:hypothetical protein D9756_000863 [Leucocoprinus leucothites]|uniref:Uncharacterized protein n=1 Tax=Leucocoprinus leucothites TaxID=201217 RepID=A0A8H5GF92_9AGAR|nr:hypothetical protein D9756_000863 [Leucoagaricus leucothites]